MKKRNILFPLFILLVAVLAGCHRECVCYGYGSTEVHYTPDEVDARADGNCSNMIYQAGVRYHSLCEWE